MDTFLFEIKFAETLDEIIYHCTINL